MNKIIPDIVTKCEKITRAYLKLHPSPRGSHSRYIWHVYFFEDTREFLVDHIDDDIVIVASKYFPDRLARVIISKDIIAFVHYDGRVQTSVYS